MHSLIHSANKWELQFLRSMKSREHGMALAPQGWLPRPPSVPWQTLLMDHRALLTRFRGSLRILKAIPQAASTQHLGWHDLYHIFR